MTPRPDPPPSSEPTPEGTSGTSIQMANSGSGIGSLFSAKWWVARWERALGPTPVRPARSQSRALRVSGRKNPLDLHLLRLEDLEPPTISDPESLPLEFGETMQALFKKYLSQPTSNSFHTRQLDNQNTYWVAIPSADRSLGLTGILVSMPENQLPGPRDRLVLRKPSENWPSRWVEVSPVGAVRLEPEIVDRMAAATTSAGVAFIGMLVN